MLFNTLKVIHIFSIIAWMAGLLYLPRLFVNHANPEITKETSETFKLMEGKLYRIIMFPAFIVTWISGFTLTHYVCLLYTSPSPRDRTRSRMPSSA